jgi:hypothetical protein
MKNAPLPPPTGHNLTPRPEQGFPYCHGDHGLWYMDNSKEAQINAFLDVPGPCLVIHVADEVSHDRQRSPLVASGVREALNRLFPNEKTKVVNLMPLTKPKRHEDPPFAFFAYNMQPSTYEALVNQCVWRTDFIRLWAYPIEPITPAYLSYIIDLSSIDN